MQQARESARAELEQRWRILLNEERALRNKEVQGRRNADLVSRVDDTIREMRE